jgi:hypothetical protein
MMSKTTKPLTASEKKWVAKLEAVLAECPSTRIGAFTIGDCEINLYDNSFEKEINSRMDRVGGDFCSTVQTLGCGLGSVSFPFPVHSTCG